MGSCVVGSLIKTAQLSIQWLALMWLHWSWEKFALLCPMGLSTHLNWQQRRMPGHSIYSMEKTI